VESAENAGMKNNFKGITGKIIGKAGSAFRERGPGMLESGKK
jgi:ribosomal protein L21E